jgi:fructose-bisphosphate aldolase class I
MNLETLQQTAEQMVKDPKGVLAADESNGTAGKRLRSVGVKNSEENRRRYRELFLGTEGIEKYLNAVIFYTETMRQAEEDGELFPDLLKDKDIIPGVKLDEGTVPFPGFPGEEVTEGLDGLPQRVGDYYAMGARFAKWRNVIHISDKGDEPELPTSECIHTNAIILARYARICQEGGLVPIVEPEVLLDGEHSIDRAEEVTTRMLSELFYQLRRYRAEISATILKTSMVLPGEDMRTADPKEVADATVRTLKASVPEELPGIVFLSGGQEPKEATANLNAIAKEEPLPWEVTFSYARALQRPALEVWKGKRENREPARREFLDRLKANVEADKGSYKEKN